ncbi:MAG: AAA family ATPase [Candidatus Woesearchaeota archaeon]
MIIGLTGYGESGKDTIADYLVQEFGFTKWVFSDLLGELLSSIECEDTKDYRSKLGVALRKTSGFQNILAMMLSNRIKGLDDIVITGFRSPEEVSQFRADHNDRFKLIYVERSLEKRYASRRDQKTTMEDIKKRDERDGAGMGLDKIIHNQMYNLKIINENSREELLSETALIIAKLGYGPRKAL